MSQDSGDVVDPIIRRKLSDEVLDRLKAMIIRGDFAPGDPLPSERDLMARFAVGRPAVREAMQALANLGLITISHGERARVTAPNPRSAFRQLDLLAQMMLTASPDALDHLKEARSFFELRMVREAALKATVQDVEALRETLERQKSHAGDAAPFIRADMDFHRRIAAIQGNPIFEAVSDGMLSWLFDFHASLLIWAGKENLTLAEHEAIIDAIAAQDADAAEALMKIHLERSSDLYQHHR